MGGQNGMRHPRIVNAEAETPSTEGIRPMKTTMWIAAAACAALTGCEYTVPVAKGPSGEADRSLVGVWNRVQAGHSERLLVLPVGKSEWLVSLPSNTEDAMFARAWPVRAAGLDLVQLQWLGTARGALPENDKIYQLAAFSIEGGTLTVRTVNGVGVGASSPKELIKELEAGKDRADFFREAMVYERALN